MANRLLLPSWCSNLAAVSTMGLAILDRTIRNYANDFLTEPLALFLTTCIAAVGMQLQRSDRRFGWLLLLAFLSSLLVLTRSITVFWLPGFAVLTACSCSGHRIRSAGIFLVTVVLLLSPWWIRNCLILERWMPLGGQGAASLRGGYCDEALNDFGNWHGDAEEQIQKRISQVPGSEGWTQAQREVELADGANRETWSWVTAHLADIPKLVGMRVQTHWGPYSGPSLIWRLAIVFGWLCFLCPPKKEGLWVVGLPIVSTLTVALLYETGGRFLVPLYAVLYLTAGIGVAWLAGRCWDRCKRL
jgi:4-amino-4-deoxy-L-arabinose transferase-like glycosyltransferase